MALVNDPRWRAFDANGDPLSGATLTIYDAGTFTPGDIFADAALTVDLDNPVVANSAGVFPQIFAADAQTFDILLKTSGGVLVDSDEDVPALGSVSTNLFRNFTNSRFQAYGTGGVVSMEAGDPSPDNVGGKMRLGGWAGTQADTLSLDAAVTNTTGALTVGGKKIQGVVATEATTFTAVSQLDIALPNAPTGTRAWQIELFDLFMGNATNNNMRAQLSYDGGATYKAGATDYHAEVLYGATLTVAAATTYAEIAISGDTPTNAPALMTINIVTPDSGTNATRLIGTCDAYDSSSVNPLMQRFTAFGLGSYGRATHIRLFPQSSTITGKYLVKALRGYGEA